MNISWKAAVAALAIICCAGGTARADQLADIKAHGKLVCGALGTVEPFSFQDPQTRETVGYEIDQCRAVAKALGVDLEIKLLSVEARIPELSQGRVDILAAALGYSDERAKQIDYSVTSFISRQMLMVRADGGITQINDLKDKKISAPKGSSSENYIRTLLPEANVLTYQDPPTAFLALKQMKVNALVLSELALISFQQQAGPEFTLIKQPVAIERWGLGVRKGEPALLEAVNNALKSMETSGQASEIFTKWLGADTKYKLQRSFKVGDPIGNPELAPKT